MSGVRWLSRTAFVAVILLGGCVPAEPGPRAAAAPRNIDPSRVTLMLLDSRDSDFDLAPDTFVVDVVLFSEFESPLPVRPAGSMRFELIDARGQSLAIWEIPTGALAQVARKTALGLDGFRLSLRMSAVGAEDDVPRQAGRLRARFIPADGDGAVATGETPVRLGLSQ